MSVEVLDLPKTDDKLAPITKVKTEIARMRKAFSGLKIKDVNDRHGLLKVSTARKEVKAVRVQVEKERKTLNEDALKWQRQVNEAAKEITSELIEIETPLQEMEDAIIDEKQRIKEEAERVRKEKIQNRAQVVTSFQGVTFNGLSYSLGEVKIDHADLESLPDDKFQTEIEKLEAEYQSILEARLETERLAKEDADRLEAQRLEQEAAAAELKRQQDEIAAERKRLDDEKAEHEAALKREQDEKDAEARRLKAEADAKEAEEKRLAEIEAARVEAAEQARVAAELKAKQDAEAKAEADRLAKEKDARKKARRPDLEKFTDMTNQIKVILDSFTFTTEDGKNAQADFKTGVELLIKASPLTKSE
ncbi:hypothetical protein [Dyadobacter alkalitolerans]|uniref:hypothetical protein n=1 Tax=Dyadobacter alkalitolerans TaxID=492736 RepID=UPI00040FDBA5|nr:hypothetical protein [Dyadobacter alkalitolerans]